MGKTQLKGAHWPPQEVTSQQSENKLRNDSESGFRGCLYLQQKRKQPTENQENTEHRNINQMVASSYIYHSKAGGSHPFILVSFVNVADLC